MHELNFSFKKFKHKIETKGYFGMGPYHAQVETRVGEGFSD